MPDDTAVLDAPVEATEETPIDAGTPDAGVDPADAPVDGAEGTPADPQEPSLTETGLVIDGKRLSESLKTTLNEIKVKDPKLATQIRNAIFSADAFKRALPGGIKEIGELKQHIEQLGGPEGIEKMQSEITYWNGIDQRFTEGDPRFIDEIEEASPDSFLKLAPVVFQKFEQRNPEGYSAYISRAIVGHMAENGIPLALERLQDFLGDNPRAIAQWKKVSDYVNALVGFSQKPIDAPAKPKVDAAVPDDREKGLTEREASLVRTEWNTERNKAATGLTSSEYDRLLAGRKVSDQQKAAIQELFGSRLKNALTKLTGHTDKVDRYFANRDQEGYLRYIGSIYKQEIPKAMRSAVETILPTKPGPAPGAKPAAAAPKPGTPAATNGFTRIVTAPARETVDMSRTSAEMWGSGKAVLIGGKRVQWK